MSSHAIVMDSYGGPEVLQWRAVPLPPLGPREVRLRTLATAVNHSDLEIRGGSWPIGREPPFPYVPGLETVGEVVEVGSEVSAFRVGDRAWTMMQGLGGVRAERPGGYAQHVTVAADALAPLSADLDPVDFATIGLAGVTAFLGLEKLRPLAERRILVTGASGRVGSAAVALGRALGARMIGLASREAKAAAVRELGAEEVLVARTRGELEALLPARSVDGVLDAVAGPLFPVLVSALRDGGALCVVGAVGGNQVSLDAWELLRGVSLTGVSTEELDGARLRGATEVLVEALGQGRLRVGPRTVVPLREAARAHAMLECHEVTGTIVLVP